MPTSKPNSDFWISGLRQQLKLTSGVGSSYRISQQSGKCKLDVVYSDNSRKTAITPIEWKQENARVIENAVKKVFGEQIKVIFSSKTINTKKPSNSQEEIKKETKTSKPIQTIEIPKKNSTEQPVTKKNYNNEYKNLADFFNGEIIDFDE